MTVRFCPDCGAECHPQDHDCRECQFPLTFKLVSQDGDLKILKSQSNRWQRIAQILRRNGIQIETHAANFPGRYLWWWALPGLGAVIFLFTILFGGKMVDRIWPPAEGPARVLDLNQVPTTAKGAAQQRDAQSQDGGDVDVSFLKEALESSEEQKEMTQNLNLDLNAVKNQPVVPEADILEMASKCLLRMEVGEDQYLGTMLNQDGMLIVDSLSINNAFRREKQTVASGGEYRQAVVYVVPKVGFVRQNTKLQAEKVDVSETLGIAFLRAPISESLPYEANFERDLGVGDTLYIATLERDALVLETRTVTNGMASPGGINLWLLDRPVNPRGSGSPVFSIHGELVGVYMYVNGQDTVLSMARIRERDPQMYREIFDR